MSLADILTKEFLEKEYSVKRRTLKEIGEEVGCCQTTVSNYLRKHSINVRTSSESYIGKYLGEKNPKYGIPLTDAQKKKLRDKGLQRAELVSSLHKGKNVSELTRQKISRAQKGKRLREETKAKIREAVSGTKNPMYGVPRPDLLGANNPSWRGGTTKISNKIRGMFEYSFWRKQIYERDGYMCVWCGSQKSNTFNADHIVPLSYLILEHQISTIEDARNCAALWDLSNGRTLCLDCHKKTDTWGHASLKYSKTKNHD